MNIKLILADDHKIMRQGLRTILERQPDIEVIAEAGDGRTAVNMANRLEPDVMVMDIGMPSLNGIEATRRITESNSDIKVVVLSMHSKKQFVIEMLKAGASGYILKDRASEELIDAVHAAFENQIYLSPKVANIVTQAYLNCLSNESSAFSVLTEREREVLQLLAEGKTTQQIGNELKVSSKTVGVHRSNIMNKLNVHSIAELTKYAIREGLTSLE